MATTTVERAAAGIQRYERGMGAFGKKVTMDELDGLVKYIRRRYFRKSGRPHPSYIVSRSGKLERSLRPVLKRAGRKRVDAYLQMTGPQAGTLEFGRKRTVVIVPKRKTILRWVDQSGKVVWARRVVQRPSAIKPRRVMQRGIQDRGTAMVRRIERELAKEWHRRVAG